MALVTCKDCGKEFSTDAKRCVHCGAKKPKATNPLWFATIAACFVLMIIMIFSDKDRDTKTKSITKTVDAISVDTGSNSKEVLSREQAVQKLSECVLPRVQYGKYSSYDGGDSVFKLITHDCAYEAHVFVDSCKREDNSGKNAEDVQKSCDHQSGLLAQGFIRMMNK